MNNLMDFIERYWGVTLAGTVTVGSLITFIIVQLKFIIRDRMKNTTIDSLMKDLKDVMSKTSSETEEWGKTKAELLAQTAAEKTELLAQYAKEKAELLAQNSYYQATQAVMFKSISYLVAASKLPIEEKLKLQEDFINLRNIDLTAGTEPTVNTAPAPTMDTAPAPKDTTVSKKPTPEKSTPVSKKVPTAKTIVDHALDTTTDLLAKYSKEGK